MIMKEQAEQNLRKFREVLLTTEKKQGRGDLFDPRIGCYCALGVYAEEVLGLNLKNVSHTPVYQVIRSSGIHDVHVFQENDNERLSFKSIADGMEKNPDLYIRDEFL